MLLPSGILLLLILFTPLAGFAFESGSIILGPTPGLAARGAVKCVGGEIFYFVSPSVAIGPTVNYLSYTLEFKNSDDKYTTKVVPSQMGMRFYLADAFFLGMGGYYAFHLETDTGNPNDVKKENNTYGPYGQLGFTAGLEHIYLELYAQINWDLNNYLVVNEQKRYMRYAIVFISAGIKI